VGAQDLIPRSMEGWPARGCSLGTRRNAPFPSRSIRRLP
jgi:hypothetical protein